MIWLLNTFILFVGLGILSTSSPFLLCLMLVLFVSLVGMWSHFVGSMWLMYTLIIMFLGGMMIVFIYTASVSNSFKFTVNLYNTILVSSLIAAWHSLAFKISGLFSSSQEGVWSIFNSISFSLVILLGFIIIMTLFTVVKLVQVDQGPLKT